MSQSTADAEAGPEPDAAPEPGLDPERRVHRWENLTEWPLALVAVLFLLVFAWPILDAHIEPHVRRTCHVIDYVTWFVFAADYVTRVTLARDRVRYWWRHLPDLAIVILPVLRPLRLLRLLMFLKILNRRAADSLRGRVAIYVGSSAVLLIFCAALAELDAERGHHGANITTFGNALWWAATTVSTVGYGDHYPITVEGRLVAAGLMVGGVALLGVVTASFATWLIDQVRDVEAKAQTATRRDIEALTAEIRSLAGELEALRGGDGGRPASPGIAT